MKAVFSPKRWRLPVATLLVVTLADAKASALDVNAAGSLGVGVGVLGGSLGVTPFVYEGSDAVHYDHLNAAVAGMLGVGARLSAPDSAFHYYVMVTANVFHFPSPLAKTAVTSGGVGASFAVLYDQTAFLGLYGDVGAGVRSTRSDRQFESIDVSLGVGLGLRTSSRSRILLPIIRVTIPTVFEGRPEVEFGVLVWLGTELRFELPTGSTSH